MSGHSKWSKVKHQKATTDAVKATAFTRASRAITIAVREGGGITDSTKNFRLRLAIDKAHSVNMPKENIERAIDRAKGDSEAHVSSILFEGYGPFGIAILIETLTDNRQRTVSFIKQALDYASGSMGAPGTVAYLFSRLGVITVEKSGHLFDTCMEHALDCGVTDMVDMTDFYELYTEPHDIYRVRDAMIEKGYVIDNATVIMRPIHTLSLTDEQKQIIDTLVEKLESLDDVQNVYTNGIESNV